MKEKSRVLTIIYFIYLGFGLSESAIEPLIPEISRNLNIGYDIIGFILFFTFFFMVLSNLFGGRFSDIYDSKVIILISIVLILFGFLIFGLFLTLSIFIISLILIRSGLGSLDSSAFTYICQFTPERKSEVFIKIHLLWCSGCAISPLVISLFLYLKINPKYLFIFIAGLFLFLNLFFLKIAPLKKNMASLHQKSMQEKKENRMGFFQSIKYPSIIISAIILFFYSGSILGLSTWLTTYFYAFNVKVYLGSAILSAYWIFSIFGAIIANRLLKKYKEMNILLFGYSIGTFFIIFAAFIPNIILKVIFLLLMAMGSACVFPLVKTISVSENMAASGTVIGVLHTFQGAGIMAVQPVIGLIAENIGKNYTIFVIVAGQLIGLCFTVILFLIIKNKKHNIKSI